MHLVLDEKAQPASYIRRAAL